MDESGRKQLLQRLRVDLSEFTPGETDFLEQCTERTLKIILSSETEPLTLLLPDDAAFLKVGVDPESDVPLEHKDQILGLMLDQIVMGSLPDRDSAGDAGREFMTLAGAPLIFSTSGGALVLTDGFGRQARVGEPMISTPKITCRPADSLLMWDEWGWA